MPKVSDAHRQARRREILDAAAACFARDGFHRTSMQDIVRESGISAGLVYRYFASKDEVIAAIVGQWHEHRAALLTGDSATDNPATSDSATSDSARKHPAERATAAALPAYLDMLRAIGAPESAADLRLGVQVWAEALRSPAIDALVLGGVERFQEFAARVIRSTQRDGGLPATLDPDALARVLIAIYQGLMLQTAWDGTVDNDAFVHAVADLVGPLIGPGQA
ncbi:TetR/AcrR family transcriptional regulator [Rugosimonospora acidiphila]|uniref:TetR/AcrR family transcriptional regulator n=1 Tax=Rugosimonospora acidiphila TaxID=556531 RepID=A0ABP9SJN5_9ACTN